MKPTKEVKKAMEHVQSYFPNVTYVIYGADARWHYVDDDFVAPRFWDNINTSLPKDVGLLEEAVDSLSTLPAIFYLPKKSQNA